MDIHSIIEAPNKLLAIETKEKRRKQMVKKLEHLPQLNRDMRTMCQCQYFNKYQVKPG